MERFVGFSAFPSSNRFKSHYEAYKIVCQPIRFNNSSTWLSVHHESIHLRTSEFMKRQQRRRKKLDWITTAKHRSRLQIFREQTNHPSAAERSLANNSASLGNPWHRLPTQRSLGSRLKAFLANHELRRSWKEKFLFMLAIREENCSPLL